MHASLVASNCYGRKMLSNASLPFLLVHLFHLHFLFLLFPHLSIPTSTSSISSFYFSTCSSLVSPLPSSPFSTSRLTSLPFPPSLDQYLLLIPGLTSSHSVPLKFTSSTTSQCSHHLFFLLLFLLA